VGEDGRKFNPINLNPAIQIFVFMPMAKNFPRMFNAICLFLLAGGTNHGQDASAYRAETNIVCLIFSREIGITPSNNCIF
jgi:hypothetical protein